MTVVAKSKSAVSLKPSIHKRTLAFAVAAVATLAWLNLGMKAKFGALTHSTLPARVASAATVLVGLLVAALDAVPGSNVKAQIVFLRRRHPLPGSRAFDRASLDADTRIDRERLRVRLGGTFPRAPAEQNTAWYRLYQQYERDGRVHDAQYAWLLFRDLTWLALVLSVVALIAASLNSYARVYALLGALAVFAAAAIFRAAAAQRARRFVNTVLSLAAAENEKPSATKPAASRKKKPKD